MRALHQLTRSEYQGLQEYGLLHEFYPDATGDFLKDSLPPVAAYAISPPQWIALADATPKAEDFPVWCFLPKQEEYHCKTSVVYCDEPGLIAHTSTTHWLPARAPYAIPEPPPAKPTQRELDDKAGVEAFSKIGRVAGITAQGFGVGWRAALDYRDAGRQP